MYKYISIIIFAGIVGVGALAVVFQKNSQFKVPFSEIGSTKESENNSKVNCSINLQNLSTEAKTYESKSKYREPSLHYDYYSDQELEYADVNVYPNLVSKDPRDAIQKTIKMFEKSVECNDKKTFKLLIGSGFPYSTDTKTFGNSVDKFWNELKDQQIFFGAIKELEPKIHNITSRFTITKLMINI
jgi:hypothetical protein